MSNRKLLCFIFSNYEEIKKKGVEDTYSFFLENGYFDEVLFIFPFAKFSNNVYLKNESIHIFQSGWLPKHFSKINYKFLKYLFFIFFFPKFLINIYKKIKLFNPDIIRSTDPYYLGIFGLLFSKILKKPFVVSVHSDYDLGDRLKGHSFRIFGSRKFAKKLERYIFKKADKIFPNSEYKKNKIKMEYPELASKIFTFLHPFDFDKVNHQTTSLIRQEFKIHKNKKILSFAGRLSPENFVFDLCKLSESLNKKNFKDYIILIFGDGELKEKLQILINQKNLKQYFILAGFQPREKVIQLRQESFFSICFMGGMSLIETLACRCPAICYDIEWHSELVINNKTGILAKEHDINFIVNSLLFYSNNPVELNKISSQAYEHVYQKHNLKKITEIKSKLYSEVISINDKKI